VNALASWGIIIGIAVALWFIVTPFMNDPRPGRWDDLEELRRHQRMTEALSQSEKAPATDACSWCAAPILRENTPSGVCDDCVRRVIDDAFESDASVRFGAWPIHLVIDTGSDVMIFHTPEQIGGFTIEESVALLPLNGHRLDLYRDDEAGAVAFLSDEVWPCTHPGCPVGAASQKMPWGWPS
jgi:hypothetical protein